MDADANLPLWRLLQEADVVGPDLQRHGGQATQSSTHHSNRSAGFLPLAAPGGKGQWFWISAVHSQVVAKADPITDPTLHSLQPQRVDSQPFAVSKDHARPFDHRESLATDPDSSFRATKQSDSFHHRKTNWRKNIFKGLTRIMG